MIAIGLSVPPADLVKLSSIARLELFHDGFEGGEDGLTTKATTANPAAPTKGPEPAPGSSRKRRPPRTLYRGDPGMWSWVLHRITGATIFFFLFVHVLDTALVRVSPQAYNSVIGTYKTPVVGLMEFGLVVAVSYHALNGIRIILIDFWSQGPRHQRLMLGVVGIVWLLILVPAAVVLGIHMWEHFR